MPIYDYKCEKCDDVFEVFQKVNDESVKKCKCGGKVKRLLSTASFRLIGDGFYAPTGKMD